MSYHLSTRNGIGAAPPYALMPAVMPYHYAPVSLAQAPSASPLARMDPGTKRTILILLGALALIAFLYVITRPKKPPMTRNRAARKLTTPELAQTLYERLEKKKGANPTVLRSLRSYSAKR